MGNRRMYSPQFKAKVELEASKNQKSPAQICREYNIGEHLLSRWKQAFVEKAPLIFATDKVKSEEQRRIEDLERLVGKLTLELEISKKVLSLSTSLSSRRGGWRRGYQRYITLIMGFNMPVRITLRSLKEQG